MTAELTVLDAGTAEPAFAEANVLIDLLLDCMADDLDHPELWREVPEMCRLMPDLRAAIAERFRANAGRQDHLLTLHALTLAAEDDLPTALAEIEQLAVMKSQSPQVQGAVFHLQGLGDPTNPKYQLHGKICPSPFEQFDVLERTSHQCCASWLSTSAGDLNTTPWQDVWNSPTAQAIRASVLDGSYRYCNKIACPKIHTNELVADAELAKRDSFWEEVVTQRRTVLERGPRVVNLAYDRTCNLACPSCRKERFAADAGERERFQRLQEDAILPMLKHAEVVFVTGSGDPFSSKNFRQLLTDLTPEDYPRLRVQLMTNGMLLTPRQWEQFPSLHRRVHLLKVSIDAATGETHEKLRLGARWPVMLENLRFAGELSAAGMVEWYELIFTVQVDNFREMGAAVDLAKSVGANGMCFARITNWGTFTTEEYASRAVFLPSHPDHAEFLEVMQDPRLQDPMIMLGDLAHFVRKIEC